MGQNAERPFDPLLCLCGLKCEKYPIEWVKMCFFGMCVGRKVARERPTCSGGSS